jgi:hypothetical protein
VSLYSDLLRLALVELPEEAAETLATEVLVDQLVQCRAMLVRTEEAPHNDARGAAEWIAELVAHDVALVRLCERVGVDQALTDPWAHPGERDRLLALLADRRIVLETSGEAVLKG